MSTYTSTTVDRFSRQNVLNINVSPGTDTCTRMSSIRGCNLLLWTHDGGRYKCMGIGLWTDF